MSKLTTQTNLNKRDVKKTATFEEFVLWFAMPPVERLKLGVETQIDFAAEFGVSEWTLSQWRKRPDFQQRTQELIRAWAFDKTSDIVYGIYRAAIKGNPHSQKLWLQYFMGFSEKTEVTHKEEQVIGVGDIRHLIDQLPEPLRSKHYANLRDLLDDAASVSNALNVEERAAWEAKPPGALPGETDNNAQDLPGARTNGVARGNTSCIRADMVGQLYAHHNQGAERWW